MMYKRSSDGKRMVRQPANLSSERARIFGSLTSLASPYSKRQFRNSTRQWSPFSASNVSCPAGSSTAARAVKRIFTDMSRKMRLIRNKGCSDRYLDMSKLASSDEIMAANLLREWDFKEAVVWADCSSLGKVETSGWGFTSSRKTLAKTSKRV